MHGEYKVVGGKLVVADLEVMDGVIRDVWRKVKVPGHIKAVLTAARALK